MGKMIWHTIGGRLARKMDVTGQERTNSMVENAKRVRAQIIISGIGHSGELFIDFPEAEIKLVGTDYIFGTDYI